MVGDAAGVSAVLAALAALIASLVAAYNAVMLRRPIGEIHAAVSTPPNVDTLGSVVSDSLDAVHDVQHALEDGHD